MSGFLCSMVGATFGVAAAAQVIRLKKGITAVGNAQIDTAQSKFGGSSALFDGTDDYLIANGDFSQTGDFTIECWFRASRVTGAQILMTIGNEATERATLYLDGSTLKYDTFSSGTPDITCSGTISTGVWYHIAAVRSGSTITVYRDGSSVGSASKTGTVGNATNAYFGADSNGLSDYQGYLDEIRYSNTARYTTTFTPSTTPFVNDAFTQLLIHCDGTDAITFFEDDNGVRAQRSIVAIGNAQIDTAQSRFGGSSALFDGTGDAINVFEPSSFVFGTNAYTIELWIRFNSMPAGFVNILDLRFNNNSANCPVLYMNGSTVNYGTPSTAVVTTSNTLVTNTWYHIAVSRSASGTRMFLNGTQIGSTYTPDNISYACDALTIGNTRDGQTSNASINGWIDEVRISNTARYTANFTAPSEPFVNDANTLLLLHMDGTDASTVFRDDNGLIPATYTSDAVAFDGTDDFYSVSGLTTTAADSKFLTMAFTWFHDSGGNSRNQHFMTCRLGTTSGENGWEVCIQSGRFRYSSFDNSGASTDMVYGDFSGPTENAWNQIVAYVDHNNFANCKYFLNGVDRTSSLLNGASVGAVNLANNNINWGSSNVSIRIGEQDSTAGYNSGFSDFLGRISQIYVHNASGAPSISDYWDHSTGRPKDLGTKGTATGLAQPLIYHYGGTSTFPTNNGTGFNSYTLTANGGVTTNAANTIYARARRQRSIFANGNAQISTAQSQFGGSSALFDGTGDFITVANHPSFNFRQNDFTIEGWVRANNFTGSPSIIGMATVSGSDGWNLQFGGDGRLYFECGLNGANPEVQLNTNAAFSTNTWGHFAFVRSGNTLTAYVNGSASGQISFTGSINPSTANMVIGDGYGLATVWSTAPDFNGYLDEIRISNTARYTAGFTVTTTPFQNDANTVLLLHMDGNNASTVFFDDNGRDTTPT